MPENWKSYKLRDLTSVITKGTTPSTYGFNFEESGINYIRAQSLSYDGKIDESVFSFISEEAHKKLKRSQLYPGDILFSMAGAYLGMTGMVKTSFCPANTNQAVGIIRINNPSVDPKFVEYLLRNPSTVSFVNAQSGQSAQPNINLAEIGNLAFEFPPLQEQKSIASILSALDDKIELNLQMNKTLEEMAMALYKHWFVDFGPFQDGEFVESELGEIPKGWEVKELREVTTELRRGISPKYTDGEGINVINQRCVRNHLIDFSLTRKHDINKKKVDGRLLELGDVLVNSTGVGTLGRIASVIDLKEDAVVDSHVTVVRADRDSYKLNVFARLMFHIEPVIEAMGEGSTGQTELSRVALGELKVIVPPLQKQIKLEDQLEIFSATIVNNLDNIKTLTQLRDTLLPKLISGEVRVKDVEKTLTEVL